MLKRFRSSFVLAILFVLIASITQAQAADESIVLAGGCFWGLEAVFEHLTGVKDVVSGYAGGEATTAHYDQVSAGDTGHAEAVQVTYDPEIITLKQILQVYFKDAHDPTQLNYQGPDYGPQYRSTIFYSADSQKAIAERMIGQLQNDKVFKKPIVTTIEPLHKFYLAEKHHQNFAALNPHYPYIMMHDAPKVRNLKKDFPDLYKDPKD